MKILNNVGLYYLWRREEEKALHQSKKILNADRSITLRGQLHRREGLLLQSTGPGCIAWKIL